MTGSRLCLALPFLATLAVAGLSAAQKKLDPEPPGKTDGEEATPAVDLKKAESDPKLAQQDKANLQKSLNNFSQIGLAFHNYHDSMGQFPDDRVDRKGKPMLSWRVLLLPYLEQGALYKEFKLDEPWDSKHNIKLLEKMPDIYRSPRVKLKEKGNTVVQVFKGPNAPFGRGAALRMASITDGTSNTLMAVESSRAVPWTKPADIDFDRKKAVPAFGKAFGDKPAAVIMDGSARVLDLKKLSAETLKNAIDPMDGNVLGKDWRE